MGAHNICSNSFNFIFLQAFQVTILYITNIPFFVEDNVQRDSGKKVQIDNIAAAKVCFLVPFYQIFKTAENCDHNNTIARRFPGNIIRYGLVVGSPLNLASEGCHFK